MKIYMEEAWKKANSESNLEIVNAGYGKNIAIEHAAILYHKFNDEPNIYGNRDRNITVLIPDRSVEVLRSFGWPVKEIETGDEDNPIIYGIKVNIGYKNPDKAPIISLITNFETRDGQTQRSSNTLTEDTVKILDSVKAKDADLIINIWYNNPDRKGRPAPKNGAERNPYSYYLKRLYVIQDAEFNFRGKYDDLDDPAVKEELDDNLTMAFEDED